MIKFPRLHRASRLGTLDKHCKIFNCRCPWLSRAWRYLRGQRGRAVDDLTSEDAGEFWRPRTGEYTRAQFEQAQAEASLIQAMKHSRSGGNAVDAKCSKNGTLESGGKRPISQAEREAEMANGNFYTTKKRLRGRSVSGTLEAWSVIATHISRTHGCLKK